MEALNNGAKYIVTDTPLKNDLVSKNILVVNDTISFLFKIATYKRNVFNGKIIGITGSVGKTSVKENLKYFLSSFSKVSASIKSYNNFLGAIISLINIDLLSDFGCGMCRYLLLKPNNPTAIPQCIASSIVVDE